MDLELRPMSTGQLLDRTFWLYRRNFILFAGIAAIPLVSFFLGELALVSLTSLTATPSMTQAMSGAAALGFFVLAIFYLASYALSTGACVYAVSHAYLRKQTTILESYKVVMARLGTLILMGILLFLALGGLIVGIGALIGVIGAGILAAGIGRAGDFIMVIVAIVLGLLGCYVALRMGLSIQTCVLEKLGALASLKRSFSLARGSVGRLFIILLLSTAIAMGLILACMVPLIFLVGFLKGAGAMVALIVMVVVYFLAIVISTPISTIAFSLVYYDQRVRKEAFDLTLMMEALGQAPPPMQMSASAGTPNSIG